MFVCFKDVHSLFYLKNFYWNIINKQRDITLLTKVRPAKAMVFPVVMYGCGSWTIKKTEHWRIDAFELWCWRRLLRVPWTARRSNQSILKEISPEYSLEGLMLKLKLQYFWPPDGKNWLIGKDPDAGKEWRQEEKGMTEDEMVGWHHWLDGYEFESAPGAGDGLGNLVCCSLWGCKESDTTEQLNWTELINEQNYVSFRYSTGWLDICLPYEMIAIISLITICPHTKLL